MSKLLRVFLNADLRCAHDGLKAMAKKQKVKLEELKEGELVLFVNAERNRIKLFGANNVLAYLKLDRGRIDFRTISLIPRAFSASGKIDYDSALKEVITKAISSKNQEVAVHEE